MVFAAKKSAVKIILSLFLKFGISLVESSTEILGGPDIYVDLLSKLELTCRVSSGSLTPAYILWKKDNKVRTQR
jgi:hypothetical protein